MIDRLSLEGKPPLAGKQRPGGVCLGGRFAERGAPRGARAAAAAAWDKHQHDMVPGFEVGHAIADRLDDSRRFMAERHRNGARARAVDHRQVRMAEARGRHLYEDLAAAGRGQVEFGNLERLRLRVRRREAGLAKNGGLDAHGIRVSGSGLGRRNADAGRDRRAGQPVNLPRRVRPCAATGLAPHEWSSPLRR